VTRRMFHSRESVTEKAGSPVVERQHKLFQCASDLLSHVSSSEAVECLSL